MAIIYFLIKKRAFFYLILICNLLGTVYGYYWYGEQLTETPVQFLAFVPDSPSATFFLCAVMIAMLLNKRLPGIEALAAVSLFKYGTWAVGMNIAFGVMNHGLGASNVMLMASHGIMAIEGLIFLSFFVIKRAEFLVAAFWLLNNDIIDYVFGVMPWYGELTSVYGHVVGYLTFLLSIITLIIIFVVYKKSPRHSLGF